MDEKRHRPFQFGLATLLEVTVWVAVFSALPLLFISLLMLGIGVIVGLGFWISVSTIVFGPAFWQWWRREDRLPPVV